MTRAKTTSGASAVDRTRVADQISTTLKWDILRGTLIRGTKLPTERDLARRYGVSSPTVREAIRALSTLGLVDVRHGSGAYVTADTALLVATALSAIIRLGDLSCFDVLSVLGTLYRQAAAEAVVKATEDDHARLRAAMSQIEAAQTVEGAANAVRQFHGAVVGGAHNALLNALCQFLVEIQTELSLELAGGSIEIWRSVFDVLRPARTRLFEAIIGRDGANVIDATGQFYQATIDVSMALPRAREVRITDPKLRHLLAAMLERVQPG